MSMTMQARRFCTQHLRIMKRFPIIDSEQKFKAEREFRERIAGESDCFGYQIESLMDNLDSSGRAIENDVITLMKGCQRDIIDLFPSEQKQITFKAYDTLKQVNVRDFHSTNLHSNVLDAFIFQNVQFNPDIFLSELEEYYGPPNSRIMEKILGFYCQNQKVDEAMKILESKENDVDLNEKVAEFLIFGHCSRGEYQEAEKLLSSLGHLKQTQQLMQSFILGSAAHGDVDRLNKYLNKIPVTSQVLLEALSLMAGQGDESLILDKLPVTNPDEMTRNSRRTIKQLLEKDCLNTAKKLILKTQELKENSTNKEKVMRISPSVIFLNSYIHATDSAYTTYEMIKQLKPVDSKILERAIILLLDLSFHDKKRKSYCQSVIRNILAKSLYTNEFQRNLDNLLSQNVTSRMKEASNEKEVIKILKHCSELGLKLNHMKEWLEALKILIPSDMNHQKTRERANLVFEELNNLILASGVKYSEHMIWNYIIKHLLSMHSKEAFKAASTIMQQKEGVDFITNPQWLYGSLGESLFYTQDVSSFMDVIQAFYNYCEDVEDNYEDYKLISLSLLVAVRTSQTNDQPADLLLEDLFQEFWTRKIKLHPEIRDKLSRQIANPFLAEAVKNMPALQIKQENKPGHSNSDYKSSKHTDTRKGRSLTSEEIEEKREKKRMRIIKEESYWKSN